MKEEEKDQEEKEAGSWLQDQTRRVRGLLALSALSGALASAAMVFQSLFLARLLSGLALDASFDMKAFWFLGYCLGLRPCLLALKDFLGMKAARQLRRELRRELLCKIVAAGPHRSRIAGDGALSAMVLEQVDAMEDYVARYLPHRMLALLTPLILVAAVWPHSGLVALLLLVTAPLVPFFMILVGHEAARASRRQFDALALLADRMRELLAGLPVLRQLNALVPAGEELAASAASYRKRTLSVLRLAFLSSAVLELFASLAIALTAVYLGMGLLGHVPWARGRIPVPLESGLFILLLIPEFYLALRRFGADYHARARALGAAAALQPLVRAAGVAETSGGRRFSMKAPPAIGIEGMEWRPGGGKAVLRNVDLHIRPGQRVGLVGPSGAGKTSLLHLLLGFDRPTEGEIRIDGQGLHTLDADHFRSQIAWLGQRPEWFSGSVAENLRLARPDASDAALRKALEEALAWDFIRILPHGLDSRIGEGGRGFSGGQLQRLALARALLQDAWLWILDEPAAHLDPETAIAVRRHLGRVSAGKTLILATHHLEGLEWLDALIPVADGRLVQDSGT